jgi:hypothetical protein
MHSGGAGPHPFSTPAPELSATCATQPYHLRQSAPLSAKNRLHILPKSIEIIIFTPIKTIFQIPE